MTPLDMYDGYAAGVLSANPQKRRERGLEQTIEDCKKEVKRLKARILELEEALDNEEERLSTPLSVGYTPVDTDDITDYSDSEPEEGDFPPAGPLPTIVTGSK